MSTFSKSTTTTFYPHTLVHAFMPLENFGYIDELFSADIFTAVEERRHLEPAFMEKKNFFVIAPKVKDIHGMLRYNIKQYSRNLNYYTR